jgi:hypothetical protein
LQNQLHRALAGSVRASEIGAAFEAIGRFGAEFELFGGGADVLRFKVGAFEQHIYGLIVNFAILPAHDSCQRDRFVLVGDQEHLAGQGALLPVQSCEFLAIGGAPNDDGWPRSTGRGSEKMIIEGVQRLPDFQHHVVGDIDDIIDAADADLFQR